MNAKARKAKSEFKLKAVKVPINPHLPCIESEEETSLRSPDEVVRRLIALWAVVGKALMGIDSRFANYIVAHEMQSWLSDVERTFLLDSGQTEKRDGIHFSWQLEALYFIAWCAGLVEECTEIPSKESSVMSILDLFPSGTESCDKLRAAIRLRKKDEVMDRADILYRLHWAIRDAQLNNSTTPKGVNSGVVKEWHRAVNWMIRYDAEDNWDNVGTDT